MDFTKLKIGDVLEIRGKRYEIIGVMNDFECLPPKYELKHMLTFPLLKKGGKGITPTHWMGYYLDTKEVRLSGELKLLKIEEVKIISSSH